MERRSFIKTGLLAALASSGAGSSLAEPGKPKQIARRPLGRTGEQVCSLCFPGTAVMSVDQPTANRRVAEGVDRGMNYLDVSPTYLDAEDRLGPALRPYRTQCFLASKTDGRDSATAEADLNKSLKTLQTDHFDLYHFHALEKMEDVERIFAPKGAMEAIEVGRKAGKLRFTGFSAHSVPVALAAMERAHFDVVMFPANFVLFQRTGFGPSVLKKCNETGSAFVALKAIARGKYPASLPKERHTDKCWYEPCAIEEAALALRWTLSLPIASAIPTGNTELFRLAMDVAQDFRPLTAAEEQALIVYGKTAVPLFDERI